MQNNLIQNPLFSLQPTTIKAKIGEPAYFDIWLVKDCEITIDNTYDSVNVIENFNAGNKINFALCASKGGTYNIQIIGKLKTPEPTEPIEPDNTESGTNQDANAGIMPTELIVNGTETDEGDNNGGGDTETEPPNINDSAVSIPLVPLEPAIRTRQDETLIVVVEIEMPCELKELCQLFPELAPTMTTQEEIDKWGAVLQKVKCIYQEFAQPKTQCQAYPLLVLTAHYGIINGLGASVGITRADGVVASSSVGDISVSFQTQPYGSNEFTYFLGLTKYGLEFLAWLNRRSGLFYAN